MLIFLCLERLLQPGVTFIDIAVLLSIVIHIAQHYDPRCDVWTAEECPVLHAVANQTHHLLATSTFGVVHCLLLLLVQDSSLTSAICPLQ